MELQWVGLVAGSATFCGVWIGHVCVRKIEFRVEKLWIPIAVTLLLGLSLEILSLFTDYLIVTAVFGILGVTLLWDSLEFWRQQKRVKKGYAPANPENPRHACILDEYPSTTTFDLLNRDPVGHPVGKEEAIRLAVKK